MPLLTSTNNRFLSLSILLIRVMIGLILFVAGAGKLFGWFGGFGMEATLKAFRDFNNISAFWTYISTLTEWLGGFFLMIGFLTRPAAFLVFINMAVAVYVTGLKKFFMGGAAFPFTLMILALAILLSGPMRYSLDALLFRRKLNGGDKAGLAD